MAINIQTGKRAGMIPGDEKKASRYQLRHAAGRYWLLDMEQSGVPYRKPIPINDAGAGIWRLLEQGYGVNEIADGLCGEYQADREQMLRDIEEFQEELRKQGISI